MVGLAESSMFGLRRLLEGRDEGGVRLLRRRVRHESALVAAARAAAASGYRRGKGRSSDCDDEESGEELSHRFLYPFLSIKLGLGECLRGSCIRGSRLTSG